MYLAARSTVWEKKGAAKSSVRKAGTKAELDKLEGIKLVEVGGQRLPFSIWAVNTRCLRTPVRIAAAPWQKERSKAMK